LAARKLNDDADVQTLVARYFVVNGTDLYQHGRDFMTKALSFCGPNYFRDFQQAVSNSFFTTSLIFKVQTQSLDKFLLVPRAPVNPDMGINFLAFPHTSQSTSSLGRWN
jgi:hypothetical protein